MIRIAVVTNIPAPYRSPIYERIAQSADVSLQVIFCSKREPNRLWNLPSLNFSHTYLREQFKNYRGRYIHNNLDVIAKLRKFSPDVVVTTGFNPTHLYAFGYALFNRRSHVPMTDGTYESERSLSALHRLVRRFVYKRSKAFVYASLGGRMLYKTYGIPADICFKSHLCVDNNTFSPNSKQEEKVFDFIFCGRIEPVKNPLFALKLAKEVALRLNRKIRILFVGSGDQEAAVKDESALHPHLVESVFSGFVTQLDLPRLYRSSQIFLFPTLWDPWGVVTNEACAAGLPVLVSPFAGVAGELVLDGENGFVCALDVGLWADRAILLLTKPSIYKIFSERSRNLVNDYTFDRAAAGLVAACHLSLN